MSSPLEKLLNERRVLLADGATGTNYFQMGLEAGEPPEFWMTDHPDRIQDLHQRFVDAGADIILTNTFGCNRHRLKLHKAQDRTFELNKRAAELAREVAEKAGRTVIVAGSVGPTGELFEPLGALTEAEAIDTFAEQMEGLKAGGADVAWIETMSAIEEVRAAANAAIRVGMPYTVTCSFDTAGRTMMGLMPGDLASIFEGLEVQPIAMGANCGVGASELIATVMGITAARPDAHVVAKGNCGVPQYRDGHIHYTGTPELMADYARIALDAGARIIGGCCGTSPEHLAAMRKSLETYTRGERPTDELIEQRLGPVSVLAKGIDTAADGAAKRERRRG